MSNQYLTGFEGTAARHKLFVLKTLYHSEGTPIYQSLLRISVLLLLLLAITSAGWGQIAQRGTATSATSNSTTLTIDKPAGLAAGDVMIVNITKTDSYNVDASGTGWILLAGDRLGAGSRRTTILYRVADGTEGPSFQFSLGAGTTSSVGSIIAFSGVDASVFDVNPGSLQVGAGNSIPVTGITTNTDNAAVLFLAGAGGTQQGAYSNWNVTSPVLTEIMDFIYSNNIHNSVGAAWGILSTAGNTGNGTVSLLSSQYHGGMLIALKPAFQPGSQPVSFVNYGGAEQVVFDNAYLHFDIPVFRVHSEVAVSRIYIEVSESSDFTQMISFQEFKQGLGANTSSNYACNLFTPALEFKANKTYYARVRGWVGGQWSPWSEPISFTFKSQSVDLPEWHQTTNAQFESNSLTRLFAQNNTLGVMEQITINKGIFNGRDDAYSYLYYKLLYKRIFTIWFQSYWRFPFQRPSDSTRR